LNKNLSENYTPGGLPAAGDVDESNFRIDSKVIFALIVIFFTISASAFFPFPSADCHTFGSPGFAVLMGVPVTGKKIGSIFLVTTVILKEPKDPHV
jgi:hypothetical protein